jgi:hypothetical protein
MALPQGTLVNIQGLVTKAEKYKEGCVFSVYTPISKKTYGCYIDKYCPLDEGDLISGIASVEYNGTMRLNLVTRPKVELPSDAETIAGKLQQALTWKRSRFSSDKAFELYDSLSLGNGVEEIDKLIIAVRLYGEKLDVDLKDWQKKRLVSWWYKQRILRRFYLLGMTNREINYYRDEILELHEKIVTNPYRVPAIPIDKCKEIIEQYELTEELSWQEPLGLVVRYIHGKMEQGWTGVPISILHKSFPRFSEMIDLLRRDYGVIIHDKIVYLDHAYRAETFLVDLVKKARIVQPVDVVISSHLTAEQTKAIEMALSHDLCIITGGPGTGKTTLLKELVRLTKVELASFTGKAVVRMTEVTGQRAHTLHQLLGCSSKSKKIEHLVIDEASMVGIDLLYRVIVRFSPSKITLIGDKDQLEAIEWGNMFDSLIASGLVPTVRLTKNHRSGEGIESNLSIIRSCSELEEVEELPELQNYDDFTIIEGEIKEVEMILGLIKEMKLPTVRFKVITPYNKDIGVINSICQQLFNSERGKVVNGREFRVGDPVTLTDNRYDIGVMNGQEGRIVEILADKLVVDFGKRTEFPYTAYDDEISTDLLELSYAITVHRAQGSEWDVVIFYVPKDAKDSFITRRLVYTALSRAKRQVYYVGGTHSERRGLLQASSYRCNNLLKRLTC